MATKFLRKIILEELQKVLKEEEIPGAEPGQNMSYMPSGPSGMSKQTKSPYFPGPSKDSKPKPKVKSKSQLRREAIRRMQKELERLGYPGGLQKPGVFDGDTLDHLQTTFPGIDKTRTPDSISTDTINTFVSFLKKKPTGYADVALANKKEIPAQRGISAGQTGMSVVPPATPVATDNLGITKKELEPEPVGPTAAQKAALEAQAKKEREERAKVQKALVPQVPRESITREINKLLKML